MGGVSSQTKLVLIGSHAAVSNTIPIRFGWRMERPDPSPHVDNTDNAYLDTRGAGQLEKDRAFTSYKRVKQEEGWVRPSSE